MYLNKDYFSKLLKTEPPDVKGKYIYLVDNMGIALSIIGAGSRALYITSEGDGYYTIDDFINKMDSVMYKGTYQMDYVYVPALSRRQDNEKLEQYFKDNHIDYHVGWQLLKHREYLSKSEYEAELKKTLLDFVARYEGRQDLEPGLTQYHIYNDNGRPIRPYDEAIVAHIKQQCPLFLMGGVPYLYDGGVYVPDTTGARLCGMIKAHIEPKLINYNVVRRIYNLFFLEADLIRLYDQINLYPASWVCFTNCMCDAKTGEIHALSPDYYCINQIPWSYEPNANCDGSAVEQFLRTALYDDDAKTIWQTLGLLLTRDNSLQKLILLWGGRGTGKSTLLRLVSCLLGQNNIANIPLQKLEEKFCAIQIMGKLANICADLPSSAMQTVATIKQITGGDAISDSYKGKDIITFTPYARLVFSCNSVPVSLDEKSNAFFERLIIIKMDKRSDSPDRELDSKLATEMPYVINKAMQAVKEMYAENGIYESENSKQLVGELYNDSDSVQAFLTARTTQEISQSIKTTELLTGYKQFCQEQEREPLSRTNFYRNLRGKGIGKKTIHGVEYFAGLGWKSENWEPISTESTQQELPRGWS